jgi:branched-chain amino acid transport system substrate-binding protein
MKGPQKLRGGLLLVAAGVLTILVGLAPTNAAPAAITFGILGAFTGIHSNVGPAILEGGRAAQTEINEAGGILGRRLEFAQADTASDAADAVPAINKIIGANHIFAMLGPTSTELYAIQPIVDKNHVPTMFFGGIIAFDKNTDPWIWRPNPSDSQLSVAMAVYALKKGYKTAAMLFYTDITSQTLKAPIARVFEKGGGKIVADVKLSPGQTSYRSEVQKVIDAHPQVIFTQTDSGTAAVMYNDFKELDNLAIPFIGTDFTAGGEYVKAITPAVAHKVLVSLEGATTPGKAGDTFVKYYKQLYTHQPLASANYSYDAAIVLALAIDKAGALDPNKVIASIPAVSNPPGTKCFDYRGCLALLKRGTKINYDGASGPIDFDATHNVTGPFDVVQADNDGVEHTIMTITADEMAAAQR